MQQIELSKEWGGRAPGTRLDVLLPHESPRAGAVDPQRAEALVSRRQARLLTEEALEAEKASAASQKRARASSGAAKKER